MVSQHNKSYFWWIYITFILVNFEFVWTNPVGSNADKTMEILMKGAKPLQHDSYLCATYPVEDEEIYVYKFEAMANASTAHHMLLYGCDGAAFDSLYGPKKDVWQCPPICNGGQSIMFAWAKNAPPTVLPDEVGLRIGKKTTIKTIVLQVHYAKAFKASDNPDHSGMKIYLTPKRPRYVAGIFLMMSTYFTVPPKTSSYPVDLSCIYGGPKSIFPFAYRTHAHGLGKVITGYQYNDSYHEIGKGNPQWPQAFYPAKTKVEIKPGDYVAARCTYDSSDMTKAVGVGSTGDDEMCNFYMMFYTDSSTKNPSYQCTNNQFPKLTGSHFPPDVSIPLPHNAKLEEEAKGHHHHHGGMPHHIEEEPNQSVITTTIGGEKLLEEVSQENGLTTGTKSSLQHFKTEISPDSPVVKSTVYGHDKDINDIMHREQPLENYYSSEDINPRQLSLEKRVNHEYYDNYAANDLREQDRYDASDIELSRNRNKDFEAMNQQLQHHYPQRNHSSWHQNPPQQEQLQKPRLQQPLNGPHSQGPNNSHLQHLQGSHRIVQSQVAKSFAGDEVAKGHKSRIHIEEKFVLNTSWPEQDIHIGQVAGLSTDKDGNVYIFHRGTRTWSGKSFDLDNNFQYQDSPITEDVVIILDPNGRLIRKFGSGSFFMPHGIHVDDKKNIWLTDVALHQVFKIPFNEEKPTLTLGKRFLHSTDLSYFCKPTDVAVLSTGEFFVTDGYCNSRVMKFSPEGKLMKSWGEGQSYTGIDPYSEKGVFAIPHSITVSEKDNLLCVADRENGRIQCYDLDGNFKRIIKHKEFGGRLFAVAFCPEHGGLLYAVNGPSYDGKGVTTVQGFTMEMKTGDLYEVWNIPQGLKNPHDVCVDPKSHSVYVGELNPLMIWKLTRMNETVAQKTKSEYKDHHDDHNDAIKNVKKGGTSAPQVKSRSTTQTSVHKTSSNGTGDSVQKLKLQEEDHHKVTVSIVVGCLLVIPVVLVLVIALVFRCHRSGKLKFFGNGTDKGNHKRVFNFQRLLGNSHKGFDPLSTEESDHELDPEDSDHDEYTAPKKNRKNKA